METGPKPSTSVKSDDDDDDDDDVKLYTANIFFVQCWTASDMGAADIYKMSRKLRSHGQREVLREVR